jgi:hypothetical protein
MKTLFIFLFVPALIQAVTVEKHLSLPGQSLSQIFIVENQHAMFMKKSNYFDVKKNDLRLGTMTMTNLTPDYKSTVSSLEKFSNKFKDADSFLKTQEKTFNTLFLHPPHSTLIIVDGFEIDQNSEYYTELNKLFVKLQGQKWRMKEGYGVTSNLGEVYKIEDEKNAKSEPFLKAFYCDHPTNTKSCSIPSGIIYLQ